MKIFFKIAGFLVSTLVIVFAITTILPISENNDSSNSQDDLSLIKSSLDQFAEDVEGYKAITEVRTIEKKEQSTRLDTRNFEVAVEDLKQDELEFRVINSIFSLLREYRFKSVKPGVNPFEHGIFPNPNSLKLMLTNRGASEEEAARIIEDYQYQFISGGDDFRLTASFITDESINFIKNFYDISGTDSQKTKAIPEIKGKTVTFSLDNYNNFDFSWQEQVHPLFLFILEDRLVFEGYHPEDRLRSKLTVQNADGNSFIREEVVFSNSEGENRLVDEQQRTDELIRYRFNTEGKAFMGLGGLFDDGSSTEEWKTIEKGDFEYLFYNNLFNFALRPASVHTKPIKKFVNSASFDASRHLVKSMTEEGSVLYQLQPTQDMIAYIYSYLLDSVHQYPVDTSQAQLDLSDEVDSELVSSGAIDGYLDHVAKNTTILITVDAKSKDIQNITYEMKLYPSRDDFSGRAILLSLRLSPVNYNNVVESDYFGE